MLSLPIKLEVPDRRFIGSQKKLPQQARRSLDRLIDQLTKEKILPPSRNLEIVTGYHNVYSIRIGRNYRVALEMVDHGVGRFLLAAKHSTFYDTLNRRR